MVGKFFADNNDTDDNNNSNNNDFQPGVPISSIYDIVFDSSSNFAKKHTNFGYVDGARWVDDV